MDELKSMKKGGEVHHEQEQFISEIRKLIKDKDYLVQNLQTLQKLVEEREKTID